MKDKNAMAVGGFGVTDAEVIESLGLDPRLAGKKEINAEAIKATYKRHMQSLVDQGTPEKEAHKLAMAERDRAVQRIRAVEQQTGEKLL